MEIEKLIERLNGLYTALREEGEQKCSPEINTVTFVLMDAATSLSTLQAKNESLLAEVEHWRNAHHQAALNFQQENRECNKVLAELEQVRREKDAAVECCRGYCESCAFERDCAKHDMNDAAPTRWYYGDCEDWEWRGPEEG